MEQYFLEFMGMSRARKVHEFQLALGTSGSQILFALAFLVIYPADNMHDSLPIRQVTMKSCLPRWKIYLSSHDFEGNFVKFTQIFKSFWSGIAIPYDLPGISGKLKKKIDFGFSRNFLRKLLYHLPCLKCSSFFGWMEIPCFIFLSKCASREQVCCLH